ncbi:hypothetical protein [Microbacterium sp. NPDC087868]
MSAIHVPGRLRHFLPGKPDAETAFWLAVCGTAYAFGIGMTAFIIQVVSL